MGFSASIWLWWPWRHLVDAQAGRFAPAQEVVRLAIAIFVVAGLVNLGFTFIFIRKQAKIRNGFNLVAGAISIMAFLFMLVVGA